MTTQHLRPSLDLEFGSYLVSINDLDRVKEYIVPQQDVRERISREIHRRTGIPPAILAGRDGVKEEKSWVSARPGEFISQTHIAVERIAQLLQRSKAMSFELAFHNTSLPPNEFGDSILVAVRYPQAK
ncbi:MAG: hypothetical protein ACYC23_16520 [Limisphaerales bacterium]